jgi:hypothetical protein
MPVQPRASGLLAIAHRGDADSLLLQEAGEKIADFTIIVDDKNMRGLVHAM